MMKTESRFFPIFRVLVVVFLILVAVAALVPFSGSFSSLNRKKDVFPAFAWIPKPGWENYVKIFERAPGGNMLNSMYYVSASLF
jgi:ABC-type glycerol-3-phosphate transport system permease component